MTELNQGSLVLQRYRLDAMIGSGGMSVLWRARDTQLDADVVVKLMSQGLIDSPKMRSRFVQEAKAAAKLRSPHIVTIQDLGVDHGTPFMVMELLDGEDLGERLDREGRLPLAVAAEILSQAARGLATAHERGVIHRDLKPSNLFLVRNDNQLLAKVVDFGVAKLAQAGSLHGEPLTATGQLIGTPHYMSPEQALGGRDVDHRSDLWSLAMIAFRMITGRMAINVEMAAAALVAVISNELPRATEVAPDLPPALDGFFERAFRTRPEERYQSARELSDAFRAIVVEALGPMAMNDAALLAASAPTSRRIAVGHDVNPDLATVPVMPAPSHPGDHGSVPGGAGSYPSMPHAGSYPSVPPPGAGSYPSVPPPGAGSHPSVPPAAGSYPSVHAPGRTTAAGSHVLPPARLTESSLVGRVVAAGAVLLALAVLTALYLVTRTADPGASDAAEATQAGRAEAAPSASGADAGAPSEDD